MKKLLGLLILLCTTKSAFAADRYLEAKDVCGMAEVLAICINSRELRYEKSLYQRYDKAYYRTKVAKKLLVHHCIYLQWSLPYWQKRNVKKMDGEMQVYKCIKPIAQRYGIAPHELFFASCYACFIKKYQEQNFIPTLKKIHNSQ